ncbi:MAG: hypothetical protein HQ472_04905 [Ignavibacteria bacterium]|nr:hypothetical protein [Ignavibacteria bacterium]
MNEVRSDLITRGLLYLESSARRQLITQKSEWLTPENTSDLAPLIEALELFANHETESVIQLLSEYVRIRESAPNSEYIFHALVVLSFVYFIYRKTQSALDTVQFARQLPIPTTKQIELDGANPKMHAIG